MSTLMLDYLVRSLEDVFVQFSFRRLLYVAFLLALAVGALYVFDEMTGYSLHRRVDGQIDAIERLHALERAGIGSSPELVPLYKSVVRELSIQKLRPFSYSFRTEPFLKFAGAALVPVAFVIVGVFQVIRGVQEATSMLIGALMMTLLLGVPALFVPVWHSIGATVAILFGAQILLMYLIGRWSGARRRRVAEGHVLFVDQ